MYKKTNQGIQFTPIAKVNVIAHITSSLLLDNKYTDREILAILLHEIGHNFSDSIDGNLGLFSSFKKVLFIPYIFINPIRMTNVGTNININFNDYMRKNNPKLVSAFNALKLFTGKIKYAMINLSRLSQLQPSVAVSSLIMQFHKMIVGALRNPAGALTNVLFKFVGKHDEYVSDSFVAMYGYGPDLSSALLKLERTNPTFIDDIMKSGEFSAAYFSVVVEFVDYIGMLLTDNHPSTGKRLLNVLNVLEQQYNKNYINPKTKKAIKEEIDEIKELIEKEQREYAFEGNKWRIEWNKYVLANSSNKGPKEKMVKELIDTIDNMEEIKD